jgi:hypothetical protein
MLPLGATCVRNREPTTVRRRSPSQAATACANCHRRQPLDRDPTNPILLTRVNTGQTRALLRGFARKPLSFLVLQVGPSVVGVFLRFSPFLPVLALNL